MPNRKLTPSVIDLAEATLNKYRSYSYTALVEILDKTQKNPDHVELIDFCENNNEYQVTVDAFWDDEKDGDIRYVVSAFPVPIKPFLGFIPISFTSSIDSFIMKTDGTFIGEEDSDN